MILTVHGVQPDGLLTTVTCEEQTGLQECVQRRNLKLRKPDAGQAFQAASFLLCIYLTLQLTKGWDGTEFSGGWLTGPLLTMADIATLLFILALALTFLLPRVAATVGVASSFLCLPLCCFFIAPLPFAHLFARGIEFSSQPMPGFHWRMWPVTTLVGVAFASYFCIRRFGMSGSKPTTH